MKTLSEIKEYVSDKNLQIAYITQGVNGYPKNTEDEIGFIGFDNYEQALELEKELTEKGSDVKICLLKRRDGHHLWENIGAKYQALTVDDYLADLGDNYYIFEPESELNVLKERIQDCTSFEDIESLIRIYTELYNECNKCDKDESVIVHEGNYYEIVKNKTMSYAEDVYTYAVAVVVRFN